MLIALKLMNLDTDSVVLKNKSKRGKGEPDVAVHPVIPAFRKRLQKDQKFNTWATGHSGSKKLRKEGREGGKEEKREGKKEKEVSER